MSARRDRGSKPGRAETVQQGSVHESPGAEGNRPNPLISGSLFNEGVAA
jgi:hypothetical protein